MSKVNIHIECSGQSRTIEADYFVATVWDAHSESVKIVSASGNGVGGQMEVYMHFEALVSNMNMLLQDGNTPDPIKDTMKRLQTDLHALDNLARQKMSSRNTSKLN